MPLEESQAPVVGAAKSGILDCGLFGFFSGLAIRAVVLGALRVEIKRVILDDKATLLGDGFLAFLDFRVVKLLDPATVDADEMVVMLAVVDLENRLAGFEKVTLKKASLFELGEDAIDRGQPDIHVFAD